MIIQLYIQCLFMLKLQFYFAIFKSKYHTICIFFKFEIQRIYYIVDVSNELITIEKTS